MKKNFLYLFTFLCSLSLFVACGSDDDDDPPAKESWKELTKTYDGANLTVSLGGSALMTAGTVDVNATSAEAATIKLNNLLPDAKTVSIDGTLSEAGGLYSVKGETKVNDCTIAITGAFDGKGALALTATRTLAADITGNLSLVVVPVPTMTGMTSYVPVHWKAVTGDPTTDAMLATFGNTLGGLIASKVSAVNVKLTADGMFDVNWTTVAGETVGLPPAMTAIVKMYYTVMDGKLYLAVNKSLVDELGPLLSGFLPGLKIEDILSLLTDMGGFYGLPLEYIQTEDGTTTFLMKKDQVLPMLNIVLPIFSSSIPEEMKPMFDALMQALPLTKELEVGLPFTVTK